MEIKPRGSTWLELAVAPLWGRGQAQIRVQLAAEGKVPRTQLRLLK